jgi:hypothetical protein
MFARIGGAPKSMLGRKHLFHIHTTRHECVGQVHSAHHRGLVNDKGYRLAKQHGQHAIQPFGTYHYRLCLHRRDTRLFGATETEKHK